MALEATRVDAPTRAEWLRGEVLTVNRLSEPRSSSSDLHVPQPGTSDEYAEQVPGQPWAREQKPMAQGAARLVRPW